MSAGNRFHLDQIRLQLLDLLFESGDLLVTGRRPRSPRKGGMINLGEIDLYECLASI